MDDLADRIKDWAPIIISGLSLVAFLLGGGLLTTRLKLRRERAEREQEKREALKDSERKLFMFFRAVFDRQAFRGPYSWTSEGGPFDQAIEDTLLALTTGHLRTRDRRERVAHIEVTEIQSADPIRRRQMEEIKKKLFKIQTIEKDDEDLLSNESLLQFQAGDLKPYGAFVWSIKHRWGPFAAFLVERITSSGRQMIEGYPPYQKGTKAPRLDDHQEGILVDELNRLMRTQKFHETDAIKSVQLSDITTANLERGEAEKSLLLTNRLVLQDAFTSMLPPLYVVALDRERNGIIEAFNTMLPPLDLEPLPLPRDSEPKPF